MKAQLSAGVPVLLATLLAVVAPPGIVATECSGRQVYNETSGIVTDGVGDYPASAHCEWLIDGIIRTCYFETLHFYT